MTCSTAGQDLEITKWPAVQLFPLNLAIHEFLSKETPLYLLGITKRFYIEKFHLTKPNRLPAIYTLFYYKDNFIRTRLKFDQKLRTS